MIPLLIIKKINPDKGRIDIRIMYFLIAFEFIEKSYWIVCLINIRHIIENRVKDKFKEFSNPRISKKVKIIRPKK